MSEVGRWTVVIEYKVSRRSITSPMTQIDTHSLSELGKCLICYSQKSLSWSSWIWRAASHFRVLCLGNLVVCVFFLIHWCLELFWDQCELYRSFWNIISPISLVGLWPVQCVVCCHKCPLALFKIMFRKCCLRDMHKVLADKAQWNVFFFFIICLLWPHTTSPKVFALSAWRQLLKNSLFCLFSCSPHPS